MNVTETVRGHGCQAVVNPVLHKSNIVPQTRVQDAHGMCTVAHDCKVYGQMG
jgi:hypothetical protein